MDTLPDKGEAPSIYALFQTGARNRAAPEKRPADRDSAGNPEIGGHCQTMNYTIAIEHEKGSAYGVEFPDLPGCFSAGDTLDEALENAREAAAFHIEGILDTKGHVPVPRSLDALAGLPEYAGRTWAVVSVDLSALSGKSKRLNISLPERVLRRIDEAAAKNGESRSGFLARAALEIA